MTLSAMIDLYQIEADEKINTRLVKKMLEIEALAENIKRFGLLLPLSVRPAGNNKYKLIDGHRRHLALCMLYPEPETFSVPVLIQDEASDERAHQMSLAANIMRVPLHPVDQFRAFARMVEKGSTVEEVAQAFAVTPKMVRQRMALGSVIEPVLDAYVNEELDLNLVTLFASAPKAKQQSVWDAMQAGNIPAYSVRAMFKQTVYTEDDPITGFVGRDAYIEAGGTFVEDLFGEDGEQWVDIDIVERLAAEKVAALKQTLVDTGWQFAITEDESEHSRWAYRRLDPDRIEWGQEGDEARLAELEEMENGDDPDWDEINREMSEIDSRRRPIYTSEQKAQSGVYITRDYELVYGVIPPGNKSKDAPKKDEKKEEGMSAALVDDLNGLLTETLQFEVGTSTYGINLLLLTMIEDFEQYVPIDWPLSLSSNQRFRAKADDYDRHIAESIAALKLPGKGFREQMLHLVHQVSHEDKSQLLGLLAGRMLTKASNKSELVELMSGEDGRVAGTMERFNDFREEFFSRLSSDQIMAALKEAGVATPKGLKKKELVAHAVRETAKTDWLPAQLCWQEPKVKAKRKKAA